MSFSLTSLEHSVASFFTKAVAESKVITEKVLPLLQKLEASEVAVESVTSLIYPQAVTVERAAYAVLGKAIVALGDGAAAVAAGGVNIALDATEIADLKALAASFHAQSVAQVVAVGIKPAS